MAYQTPEQQAERDELVAGLLLPAGISEYELARVLRDRLGLPVKNERGGRKGMGTESLRRLEEAGRARCVVEPYGNRYGFRRVWFPVLLAWLVLLTHLAVGDCCGFPDSDPPWNQG